MRKLQEHLNHKNKPQREPSFHEDQPRRAAVRCMQKVAKPSTRSSSTAKTNKSDPPKEKNKSKKKTSGTGNSHYKDQRKGGNVSKKTANSAEEGSLLSKVVSEKPTSSRHIYSSGDDSSSDESGSLIHNKQSTNNDKGRSSVSHFSDIDATDEDDDSKTSEEELTAEEIEVLKKIQMKKKKTDLRSLSELALKPTASTKLPTKRMSVTQEDLHLKRLKHSRSDEESMMSESTSNEVIPPFDDESASHEVVPPSDVIEDTEMSLNESKQPSSKTQVIETFNDKANNNTEQFVGDKTADITYEEVHKELKENLGEDKRPKCEIKGPACSARFRWRQRERLVFPGEYYRYKATDEKVDKISEDHNVYILHKSLKDIRARCKSSTALARSLTREVFSDEALAACSVSGKPSSGKGKEKAEVRPPLDSEGVEAILDFVKNRALKKNWEPPNFTYIKLQMGNMLCEDRLCLKMMENASKKA